MSATKDFVSFTGLGKNGLAFKHERPRKRKKKLSQSPGQVSARSGLGRREDFATSASLKDGTQWRKTGTLGEDDDTDYRRNTVSDKYRGRASMQILRANKQKGAKGKKRSKYDESLPMDNDYLLDPKIPRLRKNHNVRTVEDLRENQRLRDDQEVGICSPLMRYERPSNLFPELPKKFTGGVRIVPPRIFASWLDPFLTDYARAPLILKAQRIWDYEYKCKEIDAIAEYYKKVLKRVKHEMYKDLCPEEIKEIDRKVIEFMQKNPKWFKELEREKVRLLEQFVAQERTYPERFHHNVRWGPRLIVGKFKDWLDEPEKSSVVNSEVSYAQLMTDLGKQRVARIRIYEQGKVAICEYEDEKNRLDFSRESYIVKECFLPGDAWDDLVDQCERASLTPDYCDFDDIWARNPASCQLFMHSPPLYMGSLMKSTLPWYGAMTLLTAFAMTRRRPEQWASYEGNASSTGENKKGYKPPASLRKEAKTKLAQQLNISMPVLDKIIKGKTTLAKANKMTKEQREKESANALNMAMNKSKAKKITRRMSKVRFNDVAGLDEAVHEFQEVIDIMTGDPRFRGKMIEPPKGILLEGPPGTGKTLLAKAVAGEAMMPFFYANGSEFVEMFVGVAASRVRDLFKRARDVAPAIIFIDELDTLGKSRAFYDMSDPASAERAQGLMQLLVEMDGFDPNTTPILVIGATNLASNLDPALLRSGRFDRSFRVGNPKRSEDRLKILQVHAKKLNVNRENDDAFLKRVSNITEDYSGADLANILNEGSILSVRRGKELMDITDIEAVIEKQVVGLVGSPLPASWGKEHLAILEASRAVLTCSRPQLCPELIQVTLKPRGEAASSLLYVNEPDHITREKLKMQGPDTVEFYVECAALLIAGRTAERVFFGEDEVSLATTKDLIYAQEYISDIVHDTGITYFRDGKFRPHFDPVLTEFFKMDKIYGKDDQRLMLKAAIKRSEQLIKEYAPVIRKVASELLATDRVYGKRICEIIAEFNKDRDDVSVIPTLVDTYPDQKVHEVTEEKPEPWVPAGTITRTVKDKGKFDLDVGFRTWLNAATGGFYDREGNVDSAFDEERDLVTSFEVENKYNKNWTAFEHSQVWTLPSYDEQRRFWNDEIKGVHDDWPDEWLPNWLQLEPWKYGGIGKPLAMYRQMQKDRIANGGGEEGQKVVMEKFNSGEYNKIDWTGKSEKEQIRAKAIEDIGTKTSEKPFGLWDPFPQNIETNRRKYFADGPTGLLNDSMEIGSLYVALATETKEKVSSGEVTSTGDDDVDFIKNAWTAQLGSSEVTSLTATKELPSALGSSITEKEVSEEVYTAWKNQGFKIDRV